MTVHYFGGGNEDTRAVYLTRDSDQSWLEDLGFDDLMRRVLEIHPGLEAVDTSVRYARIPLSSERGTRDLVLDGSVARVYIKAVPHNDIKIEVWAYKDNKRVWVRVYHNGLNYSEDEIRSSMDSIIRGRLIPEGFSHLFSTVEDVPVMFKQASVVRVKPIERLVFS